MKNKIKNVINEYMGDEERKLALVRKCLNILRSFLEEMVGDEPEKLDLETGDLRSSLYQALNILENFVKDEEKN